MMLEVRGAISLYSDVVSPDQAVLSSSFRFFCLCFVFKMYPTLLKLVDTTVPLPADSG